MNKFALLVSLILVGCANPYAKFYDGPPDARVLPGYDFQVTELNIYSTDNFERDVRELIRRGYTPLGQSSFSAGMNSVSERQLSEHAVKLGVHVVLVSNQYSHSVQGAMPITVPQTSTSYSSGSATAYGAGGTVNAYGYGTTTTYGSQTMMVPYSVARGNFDAIFFAKLQSRLGVYPVPLDDATRRRLQSNAGIIASIVSEGSSAFSADILPGDVILKVGNDSVTSVETYYQLLGKYEGSTVTLAIDRDGKAVSKTLEIRRVDTPRTSDSAQ